jgi:hypothetical protein
MGASKKGLKPVSTQRELKDRQVSDQYFRDKWIKDIISVITCVSLIVVAAIVLWHGIFSEYWRDRLLQKIIKELGGIITSFLVIGGFGWLIKK